MASTLTVTAELLARVEEVAPALNRDLAARDREGGFSRASWRLCAEAGLLGLTVPEAYGGSGLGARAAIEVVERLGEACEDAGLVFAVNSVLWSGAMPIAWFGSEEQREELLPRICDGSLITANAMTEATSGSDAFSLRTAARSVPGGWLLSGEKSLISNAPLADLYLVYAREEGRPGPFGISVFLVEADAPGLDRGEDFGTMGLRTSTLGPLRLAECPVGAGAMLGTSGSGIAVFSRAMTWERGCSFAAAVGVMQRQLRRCVEHARGRRRSGVAIGSFQAISHRLADMRVRLDASRLLVGRWAAAQDGGRDATIEASIAKLFVSEALIASSVSALEMFGGEGYVDGHPAERELRDALAGRIYGGTSEVQRNLIANDLGLV
jgi:alkylation response protein AidB-like acyl-CoA dehydrogenase